MGISEATAHRLRLNHALHAFTSIYQLKRKRTLSKKRAFLTRKRENVVKHVDLSSNLYSTAFTEVVLHIFSIIPSQAAGSESRSESVGSVILPGVRVGVIRISPTVTPTSRQNLLFRTCRQSYVFRKLEVKMA